MKGILTGSNLVEKTDGRNQQKCQHIWHIESPNGPTSQAVCTICKARAVFVNSAETMLGAKEREYYGNYRPVITGGKK